MKNLFKFKWLLLGFILSIASINQVWAGITGGDKWGDIKATHHFYFNDSITGWYGDANAVYVGLLVGRNFTYGSDGRGSTSYDMSRIDNTKLYYRAITSDYMHLNEFLFVGDDHDWSKDSDKSDWYKNENDWDDSTPTKRGDDGKKYTDAYCVTSDEVFTSDYVTLCTPSGSANCSSINLSPKNNSAVTSLNNIQLVKFAISNKGVTPTELNSGTTPAKIQMSSYKFVAGTYDGVSSESPSDWAAGSSTYYQEFTAAITATTTLTISSINSDYEFQGWYTAANGGTELGTSEELVIYPTSAMTIYARFLYNPKHTINLTYICADPSATVSTASSQIIGEATAENVTAPTVAGYTFVDWTLGDGVSNQSANLKANPISVKTLSSGTYTMRANYVEDLTTAWEVLGANPPFNGWSYGSGIEMSKKSGYSTTDKAYATLNVTSGLNSSYEFKTAKGSNNSTDFYGWGTGTSPHKQYNRTNSGTAQDVYNSTQHAGDFTPDALGEYEFLMDYSGDPYYITVTFPTAYTVTYGMGGTGGSSVTATYSGTEFSSGTSVQNGKTVTFTQEANTGYHFVEWYTTSTGTGGSSLSSSETYDHTVTSTNNVYAIFAQTDYTISLNWDGGSNAGSSTASVTAHYNTTDNLTSAITAPEKSGYTFDGYYTGQGGTGTQLIDKDGNFIANVSTYTGESDDDPTWILDEGVTLYAKWIQTVVLDKNGDAGTSGSIDVVYNNATVSGFSEAEKTGYDCDGYYTAESDGYMVFSNTGVKQAYSSNIAAYVGSDGKWKHSGATTLYAHWTAHTYTIAFDPNDANYVGDATGDMSGEGIDATYDVEFDLPACVYTRDGYDFAGWSTNPTGDVEYTDEQEDVSNVTDEDGAAITLYAIWTPKTYTVTLYYGDGTGSPKSTTVTMGATYGEGTGLSGSLPTPAYVPYNHRFLGWYTLAEGGSLVENSTQVTTASDHTLYARYIEITYVYFYNNLGWDYVFVTYDAYWDHDRDGGTANTNGAGNYGKIYHQMTPVEEGSKVYRDEIPASVLASWKYNICFNSQGLGTVGESSNYNNFDKGQAVFRRDFDSFATMFVPANTTTGDFTKNSDKCTYRSSDQWVDYKDNDPKKDIIDYRYQRGYWTKYNGTNKYGEAGFVLKGKWDNEVCDFYFRKSDNTANIYTITKYLPAGTSFKFRMYKHCKTSNTYSSWFIHNKDQAITSANAFDLGMSNNIAKSNTTYYDQINTTIAGDYKFTLNCDTASGQLKLSVQYPDPVADGDWFRVVYTWVDKSSVSHTRVCQTFTRMANNGSEWFEAHVHKAADVNSRSLKLQHYETVSGTPQWKDVHNYDLSGVTSTGVYTFNFLRSSSGTADQYELFGKYDGAYYLRSDVTDPGWDHYNMTQYGDVKMTHSDFSKHQTTDPYSHYYCQYVKDSSNVACTVATYNSPSICDTLLTDDIIGSAEVAGLYKHLPKNNPANIRFMYNDSLNTIKRAYLKSATGSGRNRFLLLHGNTKVYNNNADGTALRPDSLGLTNDEIIFVDKGNWIYELSLKASPVAKAKIIAQYNGSDRYLVGGSGDTDADWKTILGGTASATKYVLAGTYDFKTNRLMLAWTPDGKDITAALSDIDMLWVRHAQDAATQINFGTGGSLSNVNVVAAIELRYSEVVGKTGSWGEYTRTYLKHFISFPFDVNISDIFGLNGVSYDNGFIIQKYNGAERAERGYFTLDEGFWQNMLATDTLKATEGYCLMFDNDYANNPSNPMWKNKSSGSSVYLYFPASDKITSITNAAHTESTVASHLYTKDKSWTVEGKTKSHKDTDSHWNMIGSPLFHNSYIYSSTNDEATPTKLNAYYGYNMSVNSWDVEPTSLTGATGFNAMSAIMVQWHGTIQWDTVSTSYLSAPAREMEESVNYLAQLDLIYNNEVADKTYVEMKDGADTAFVLCEDLNKITKASKSNVYLFAGNYEVGYSQVPVENVTIPVGVIIRKTGTYTFSMPSNFSGTVTLIDTFDGTRTNLALEDYTVDLQKSTINNRFLLEISIHNAPTAIDGATDGSGTLKDGKAHKFIQNGQMFILKDGVIYDARGSRVK